MNRTHWAVAGVLLLATTACGSDSKSEVDVLAQAAQQLLTTVRASNYDVKKMTTADIAALTTTFSSTAYQTAQQKFLSYITDNCAAPTTSITTAP